MYGGTGELLAGHLDRLERELRAVLETVQACRQVFGGVEAARGGERAERPAAAAAVATSAAAALSASSAACGRVTSFAASSPLSSSLFSSSSLSSARSSAAGGELASCATSASDFLAQPSAGAALPRIDGALGETGWSLLRDGWVLVAPDGFRLRLNLCERAILSAMVCAPQHALSLGGLMELLTQTRSNFGQKPLATSSMRMILMRLMKKLERSGAPCPILSVHGWGYRLRVGDELAVAAGVPGAPILVPSQAQSMARPLSSSFGESLTAAIPASIPASFAHAFSVPVPAATAAAVASRTPVQPNSPKSVLAARRGAAPVRAGGADRATGALGG